MPAKIIPGLKHSSALQNPWNPPFLLSAKSGVPIEVILKYPFF
jgi:hypothetical protein